jgi:tRNA-dihydrouridine synthase
MSFRPTPLSIGSLRLPNPVVLAPMSGVTDAPFRRLAAKLGAGLVVSEMTASAKLVEGRNVRGCAAKGRVGHVVAYRLPGAREWRGVLRNHRRAVIDQYGLSARHVTGAGRARR